MRIGPIKHVFPNVTLLSNSGLWPVISLSEDVGQVHVFPMCALAICLSVVAHVASLIPTALHRPL